MNEAPKTETEVHYWSADPYASELEHTCIGDAVAELVSVTGLEDLLCAPPQKIYAWRRVNVDALKSERWLAAKALDTALEVLDIDHTLGNPESSTEPTLKMRLAARVFAAAVLSEYRPWSCERVPSEDVDALEWCKAYESGLLLPLGDADA